MRRRFTREFKLTVVRELETASLTEVCRKHSLDASVVSKWRTDFEKNPQKAFAGRGNLWKPEAELERYKRIVGELYAENEFLKKVYERLKTVQEEEKRLGRRDAT